MTPVHIPFTISEIPLQAMSPHVRKALFLTEASSEQITKERIYEAFGRITEDITPALSPDPQVRSLSFELQKENPSLIYYPRKFLIFKSNRGIREGLGKIAGSEHAKAQLIREYTNTIANPLGFRTPSIITPLQPTAEGRLVVEYAFLPDESFIHFPYTQEAVAAIDPKYARFIAASHIPKVWHGIDANTDTSHLPQAEPCSRSAEEFFKVFAGEITDCLGPHSETINRYTKKQNALEWLGERFIEAGRLLEPLFADGEGHPTYCMDDMRQDNYFFDRMVMADIEQKEAQTKTTQIIFAGAEDPVVYIDQEFGGITNNRTLALLTDVSALVGRQVSLKDPQRMHHNPSAFRREYLQTLTKINPFGVAQKTYDFVRAALIVGSAFELRTQVLIYQDLQKSWLGQANLQNLASDLQWLELLNTQTRENML